MPGRLRVLLIEDDQKAVEAIESCAKTTKDISVIASTNNSSEGLTLAKEHLPDAIILDLELHSGGGNGVSFLETLRESDIPYFPYVLVTTNNVNQIIHNKIRSLGAGFILVKTQSDYSAGMVIGFLQSVKSEIKSFNNSNGGLKNLTDESSKDREKRLVKLINMELDLIRISAKMKGRQYIRDAIFLQISTATTKSLSALVAEKYGETKISVDHAMQYAIDRAWKKTDEEDLYKHYTAYINPDRGAPTCTELIFYYVDKIKAEL